MTPRLKKNSSSASLRLSVAASVQSTLGSLLPPTLTCETTMSTGSTSTDASSGGAIAVPDWNTVAGEPAHPPSTRTATANIMDLAFMGLFLPFMGLFPPNKEWRTAPYWSECRQNFRLRLRPINRRSSPSSSLIWRFRRSPRSAHTLPGSRYSAPAPMTPPEKASLSLSLSLTPPPFGMRRSGN